ncbi:MAG: PilZ domain-containing protein [Deltaproteobacteria bacterium]|nr:PilZ domain-containing protein [Deltaproteobacteria bacterium]
MSPQAESVERRENKRFHAPTGAFAVLGPNATKVGRVIDISLSGLAFRHADKEEPLNELNEIDVFMIDDDFHVNKIPFETVSDYEIINESPLALMTTRQSGLRFGELTPSQRSLLEYFIQNHTSGEL